jgi:hypothetical protein
VNGAQIGNRDIGAKNTGIIESIVSSQTMDKEEARFNT